MRRRILLVEDDGLMRETLQGHLEEQHEVECAATVAEATERFACRKFDLAIVDLNLPDGDGLDLVEPFHAVETLVLVVTAYPRVQTAVRALKLGAFDYLTKPFDLEELDLVVAKALGHARLCDEVARMRRQSAETHGVGGLLGASRSMCTLREQIRLVAATPDTTVLVLGESGTGKELVAAAVHHESARARGPFVRVNCSSIPAPLMEAELFGHERGAFTDAKAARRGLLEAAHGGTLFLDEIGDLPLELQPKLLRVLEERSMRRVGSTREIDIDTRIVAATNRDLGRMTAEGRFREDLLFRLKVFEVCVPPLRDRAADVPALAAHFTEQFARKLGQPGLRLDERTLELLPRYRWPGNVRELRNVLERAAILAEGGEIQPEHLPADLGVRVACACAGFCPGFGDSERAYPPLARMERLYVECVYRAVGGNKTRAAEVLGITRLTLRRKLDGDEPAAGNGSTGGAVMG